MKQRIFTICISLLCIICACKDNEKIDDGKIYPTEKQESFTVENNEGTLYKEDGQWIISTKILKGNQSFEGDEIGAILIIKNMPEKFKHLERQKILFSGTLLYLYMEPFNVGGGLFYYSLNVEEIILDTNPKGRGINNDMLCGNNSIT